MPKYFKKEVPESPIYLPIGKPIKFEAVDRDYGYLATNDGYLINELSKLSASGKGGVTEVTEEEYQEFVKKKASSNSQLLQPRQRQTIGPSSRMRDAANPNAVPVAASVVGVMAGGQPVASFATPQRSDGLRVERTFVKPNVGRMNDQP